MCKVSVLRALVVERLSAAAEEIFLAVEKMITERTKQTSGISTEEQRAAVQRRLTEVADEICKMLEVMMGGHESVVHDPNAEARLQLLDITVKTEMDLYEIDRMPLSDCDGSFEQQRSGNTAAHETSNLPQTERTSSWTEFTHGEPSHLQLALKTEKSNSSLTETNNLTSENSLAQSQVLVYFEGLNEASLESEKTKALKKERVFGSVEENIDPSEKLQTEMESSSDEGNCNDVDSWIRPVTENHKPYKEFQKEAFRKYCCKVCDRTFSLRGFLLKHVKKEEQDKDVCGMCGEQFKSNDSLRLHLQTYTQTISCKDCGKHFDRPHRLKIHMRSHTGERPYNCSECDRAFSQKGNLVKHMRLHTGEKTFVCNVCGKTFAKKGTLEMHKQTHTRAYLCRGCGMRFREIPGVRQSPDLCKGCEKNAVNGENLNSDNEDEAGFSSIIRDTFTPDQSSKTTKDPQNTEYRCKVCSKTFCYRAHFVRHVKKKEKDKDFCGVCGKHFESNQSLRLHLLTYSVTSDCDVCGKQFDGQKHLQIHMRSHTGERPFVCSVCGKTFAQKSNLRGHMQVHAVEKPFICSVCWKAFTSKETLMSHIQDHIMEKSCICSVCGRNYEQMRDLGPNQYRCGACSIYWDSVKSTTAHSELEIEENFSVSNTNDSKEESFACDDNEGRTSGAAGYSTEPEKTPNEDEKFVCKVCGRSFLFRALFIRHVKREEKDKKICGVCGKRFDCEEALRLHLKNYMLIKDCEVCGKHFTCPKNLEIHMRIHTGERPYICSVCGKAFNQKSGLRTHMRVHTGAKCFSCSICGKTFARNTTLQAHMQTHTETCVCGVCGQSFRQVCGSGQNPALCELCSEQWDTVEIMSIDSEVNTEENSFLSNSDYSQAESFDTETGAGDNSYEGN